MKKFIFLLLCLLSLAATTGSAAVMQYWNFDGYAGGTTVTATTGGGSLTAGDGNLTSQTGTSLNEITPVDAGMAQALQIAGRKQNDPLITLQFSRAGMVDFVLTYASIYTGNYSIQSWAWSTDGTSFSSAGIVGGTVTGSTSWTTHTVDFSGVSALEQSGVTTIWFRDTTSYVGTGNNNSTIRFDNIQISAVPEPTTWAALGFGCIFTSVSLLRWWRQRQN